MARKSGRPTGVGRPRGSAEQRQYFGGATTPSGTPRTGAPSIEFQAQLKADIEASPEKYNLAEYSYLYPGGYPYAIEGKPVSQQQFQTYQQQLIREAERKQQEQIQKTQARTMALEAMSPRVLQEFARKATPQERAELFSGSQYRKLLEGSKGTIAFQKETQLGKETRLYDRPESLPPYQPPSRWKPSYYTEKLLPPYEESYRGKQVEGVSLIDPLIARSKTLQRFYGKSEPFFTGIEKGIYEDFRRSPTKQVALFALPFALKGVGYGVTKIATATGLAKIPGVAKGASLLGKGVGIGLTGAYVVEKGYGIYKEPTYLKKGEIIGGTAAELTSLGLGAKASDTLFGWGRTLGKKPAKVDVRYGFPTAPTGKHLELFEKGLYKGKLPGERKGELDVWHATQARLEKEFSVKPSKPRKGESVGLYVTPGTYVSGSRLGTQGYDIFGFDFPTISTPRALRLKGKGLKLGKPMGQRLGYVYIPKEKREIQGIFPVDTHFQLLGKEFYFKTRGQRIPIERYKVIPGEGFIKLPKSQQRKTLSYEQYMRRASSSGAGRRSLLDPFSLSLSSLARRKPSRARAPSPSFAVSFSSFVSPLVSRAPSRRTTKAPSISRSQARARAPSPSFAVSFSSFVSPLVSRAPSRRTTKAPSISRSQARARDPFSIAYGHGGRGSPFSSYPYSRQKPSRAYNPFKGLGLLPKGRRATQLRKEKKGRRKDYGYVPSFTSMFFGTTRKGAPRKGQIFTGLEMRPIFQPIRRRR